MSDGQPPVSMVLLCFNQQHTVADSAKACLEQTGAPIEIIFSDDASTDASFEVLQSIASAYRGPHRLSVVRNERNLGIANHINRLVERCRGDLIVQAAGDDIALPDRVAQTVSAWNASDRSVDLIASHLIDMGPAGETLGAIEVDDLSRWKTAEDWARQRPHVVGAAHAWSRRLFERFGPLAAGIAYEDQVLTLRALLGGGALTIPRPLVRYRRGGTSAGSKGRTRGEVLARMTLQNDRHLAELAQMHQDSQGAGATAAVAALDTELQRQRCLRALLQAQGGIERAQALWAARDVAPGWRLRKFADVSLAGFHAWRHRRAAQGG